MLWRPATQGAFIRAGEFALPYGIRLAEHPGYERRFGGTDTEEAPLSLSGGYATSADEFQLTAFTTSRLRCTGLGCATAGVAALYERRHDGGGAIGIQARAATFPAKIGYRQAGGALTMKQQIARTNFLVLGERGYDERWFSDANYVGHQLLAEVAGAWLAARGVLVTTTLEAFAEDLRGPQSTRGAFPVSCSYFPGRISNSPRTRASPIAAVRSHSSSCTTPFENALARRIGRLGEVVIK